MPRRKAQPLFHAGDRVEFFSCDRGGCWKPGVVRTTPYSCHSEIEIGVGNGICIRRAARKVRIMDLPIDVVPGTSPPRFRWTYVIDTPVGKRCSTEEGNLPPSMEKAVEALVMLAKRLLKDNADLREKIELTTRPTQLEVQPAPSPPPPLQPKRGK